MALGDEALAPGAPRPLDLRLAAAAAGLGFLQDALVGLGVPEVGEQRAGLRAPCRPAGRRRPRSASGRGTAPRPWRWWRRRARPADSRCARSRWPAPARRAGAGAVVAQDHHVGLEGAGHAGRQQAGAGDDVEPQVAAVVGDGGAGRCRALAADRPRASALAQS